MRLLISALAVFVLRLTAGPVTLTMDEVPFQSINSLTVSKGGISFTFTDPSGDLFYHDAGPGMITYVQDPSIMGENHSFLVAFSVPVDFIQFGLAELSFRALTGARAVLFSGSTPLATFGFDLSTVDPFAEGQFVWTGSTATSILIQPIEGPPFIAFDNLTVVPLPEPATYVLLALGVAAIGGFWHRVADKIRVGLVRN